MPIPNPEFVPGWGNNSMVPRAWRLVFQGLRNHPHVRPHVLRMLPWTVNVSLRSGLLQLQLLRPAFDDLGKEAGFFSKDCPVVYGGSKWQLVLWEGMGGVWR